MVSFVRANLYLSGPCIVLWVGLLTCTTAAGKARVEPLPILEGVNRSTVYRVFVNDTEVPVAVELTGNRIVETASFLFDGKARIRITSTDGFSRYTIRPQRFGLGDRAESAPAAQ